MPLFLRFELNKQDIISLVSVFGVQPNLQTARLGSEQLLFSDMRATGDRRPHK